MTLKVIKVSGRWVIKLTGRWEFKEDRLVKKSDAGSLKKIDW